jgi:hypothetical protein
MERCALFIKPDDRELQAVREVTPTFLLHIFSRTKFVLLMSYFDSVNL